MLKTCAAFLFATTLLLVACSGGGGIAPSVPQGDTLDLLHRHSSPKPSATPSSSPSPSSSSTPPPTGSLPPQGMYNSHETDTDLAGLEAQDLAMTQDGYTLEVNYIGLMAHKTGANSLQAWLAYDATIGMRQLINVKNAIADSDPLAGTGLVAFAPSFASDCGAVNNQQIIDCVTLVAGSSPAFYGWYIYDEPGCPNQAIGYCQGSMAGKNYANVKTLANYIATKDAHPIWGIQTPSGVPACGGWSNVCAQTQIDNLYSWLTNSSTPNTGFDYYPFPNTAGTQSAGQSAQDVGFIATYLHNTIAANYPSEKMAFTGQAFSWFQEGGAGCSSIAICPYPTTAQMQNERDQALYYANKAGNPLSMILWYYWPDVTCLNTYAGCNATTNRSNVRAAAFAPFPTAPPP
jgi:hypothetical protein